MEGHVIMKKNGVGRWVPVGRVEAKKAEGFEVVGPMAQPQPEPVQPHPVARQPKVTAQAVRETTEE